MAVEDWVEVAMAEEAREVEKVVVVRVEEGWVEVAMAEEETEEG
jgi:hypothetical protein